MKNAHQTKVIFRVLICSQRDLRPALARTLIGRQGIEVYRVEKMQDARLVGQSLGVQVILVDAEFPNAVAFIEKLRKEPATGKRSIAVLTGGLTRAGDREFRAAGANAILRLPPDVGWDERFAKLLDVPVRQQARMIVYIKMTMELESPAVILNLSPGGMLLDTDKTLHIGDEFKFRLTLPDNSNVIGSGRVARAATASSFGVEFLDLQDGGREAVLSFLRSARLDD